MRQKNLSFISEAQILVEILSQQIRLGALLGNDPRP
jgi:hypothetical protein